MDTLLWHSLAGALFSPKYSLSSCFFIFLFTTWRKPRWDPWLLNVPFACPKHVSGDREAALLTVGTGVSQEAGPKSYKRQLSLEGWPSPPSQVSKLGSDQSSWIA